MYYKVLHNLVLTSLSNHISSLVPGAHEHSGLKFLDCYNM